MPNSFQQDLTLRTFVKSKIFSLYFIVQHGYWDNFILWLQVLEKVFIHPLPFFSFT